MDADVPWFAVLGPLEVLRPDGGTLAVGGQKQRELLALLLLNRNRSVPPARLVEGLWGADPPRGADVTLRSHVYHLRRRLSGTFPVDALTTGPGGYRLSVGPGQVDAERFEGLSGLGQEALGLGQAARAVSLLRDAETLWRGEPFAELDGVDAAQVERARLVEVRLGSQEVLAAAELARGRHREVVGDLRALAADHPYRERFAALLMLALYRSGRQADALDAYQQTRQLLGDELGLDPGQELQTLAQRILQQDPLLLGEVEQGSAVSAEARSTYTTAVAPRPPDAVFRSTSATALVGRQKEVDALRAAWRHVRDGGRGVVLLSGEAGVGKTRLLAELVRDAEADRATVLVGRCETASQAYGALSSLLGDSEALATLLGSGAAADEASLTSAVIARLRQLAPDGRLLLVVENGERVDASSAMVLRRLTTRLPGGVLLAVSYRDPPGGRHAPLLELLGDATGQDTTHRVVLGPLDEAALSELVRTVAPASPGFVERLHRHTGGNPLYALEMTRALAAGGPPDENQTWDVPPGVRDLLRARLLLLSEPAREAVTVAAVLGSEVDFDVLADVLRRPEDDLARAVEEGVAAGLLIESGRSWSGRYSFPHEAMRDALQLELGGIRQRAVHLRAADALQSRGDAVGRNASIAAHLRAAGTAADPEDTARYSLAAAREARDVYAWDEAIEHAEAAVAVLTEASTTRTADAALETAMMRIKAGRGYPRAVELLQTALRRYLAAGDTRSAGVVHSRLGGALSTHYSAMDIPRALDHFAAAERLLPEPESVFHLQRGQAQAAMFGLRTELLADSAERLRSIAATLGRRDLTVLAGWAESWAALNQGRLAHTEATWERTWDVAHELADPYLGWLAVNDAALALNAYLLDPGAARRWCRRGLGQPQLTRLTHPHGAVLDQLVLALASMGELATASEAAVSLPADAVSRRLLLFLDGHWEDAEASWAAAAEADAGVGDRHDLALNLRWLAACRSVLGNPQEAVSTLDRVVDLAVDGPQLPTELDARAELARLLAADDPNQAGTHLRRCEEILDATGEDWRGLTGQVEVARAVVAGATGDVASSTAAFTRAVQTFEAYELPWRQADALAEWGRRLGEPERLDTAAAVYASIGAAARWPTLVKAQ